MFIVCVFGADQTAEVKSCPRQELDASALNGAREEKELLVRLCSYSFLRELLTSAVWSAV